MRVRTFARVRGGGGGGVEGDARVVVDEARALVSVASGGARRLRGSAAGGAIFGFDGAFGPQQDQLAVFEACVQPLVRDGLRGLNGTVFAYGQTGSGKTYSITGGAGYDSRGMIPRALEHVFADAQLELCALSYVEVYNEQVLDLLDDRKRVKVLSQGGRAVLKDVAVHAAQSEEHALDLFFRGNMQRSTGSTALNAASSRSHCVFTLRLRSRSGLQSMLNFVDLAGSEKNHDTVTSRHINLSLHFLEQVVMHLQNQQPHVAFRNSTMTALLRESLSGNSRTVFLVTLNPDEAHLSETLSSCRFAQRCRALSTSVVVNETPERRARRLAQENNRLQRDLAQAQACLREHDQIHSMLQDLLRQVDRDAEAVLAKEMLFKAGLVLCVDVDRQVLRASRGRHRRATHVRRGDVVALKRRQEAASSASAASASAASASRRRMGRRKEERGETAVAELLDAGGAVLLRIDYAHDEPNQVAWLQALEHWLDPGQLQEQQQQEEEEQQVIAKPRPPATHRDAARARPPGIGRSGWRRRAAPQVDSGGESGESDDGEGRSCSEDDDSEAEREGKEEEDEEEENENELSPLRKSVFAKMSPRPLADKGGVLASSSIAALRRALALIGGSSAEAASCLQTRH